MKSAVARRDHDTAKETQGRPGYNLCMLFLSQKKPGKYADKYGVRGDNDHAARNRCIFKGRCPEYKMQAQEHTPCKRKQQIPPAYGFE